MDAHVLDSRRREILRSILAAYSHQIDKVAVFGSHATGRARANSDIDLVIYGKLPDGALERLWTHFDDSNLPVKVDIVAYDADLYPPLKRHIDTVAVTLFTRDDLLPARSAHAA
ncbi:nucleotidyltransferase family protein [Sphingomonas bacterium]|uniref:nucleotidyltransferase family protein n=1 Tax=Sphingomonas bacterium TaxID=1895847 RepID=UPI002614D533|nr:nucleotidyltransferase domain-containing protein [Sphingomonas bacterium]